MTVFWLGFAAFAGLSFVANLFDAEFREASARLCVGLVMTPFYGLAMVADRFLPRGRRISARALSRFAATSDRTSGWTMSYRGSGVLLVRRARMASGRSKRKNPIHVRGSGE